MRLLSDENRRFLLVPLAALVAVLPLINHGVSCGHDFNFHLLSWMEAARQFSHGTFYPRWAFTPAYNAGEPRFVFYPPLSWALGGLLGFLPGSEIAAWNAAPIIFTWIALTLSGFAVYRLSCDFAGAKASLFAAILYLSNLYMLFNAYERTAYAELLAAAWIPMLLYSILRDRVTIPSIAIPLALLWLTDAPVAVIGSYTLALLTILRLIQDTWHSKRPAIPSRRSTPKLLARNVMIGTILGLALAAFYLVPAACERHFVQTEIVITGHDRIDHNFLFEHTGTSFSARHYDAVNHTASLIAVTLVLAITLALAVIHFRLGRETSTMSAPQMDSRRPEMSHNAPFPSILLGFLTAAILFFLTPLSLRLWDYIPQAKYVQFPWRLLTILAPVFAISVARSLELLWGSNILASARHAKTSALGFLLRCVEHCFSSWGILFSLTAITAALTLSPIHSLRQPCHINNTPLARLIFFRSSGSRPTREYTPSTAYNGMLASTNPPYWLADSINDSAPAGAKPGPAPLHLTVMPPRPQFLILNLRDYPSWHITRNGTPMPRPAQPFAQRYDGLIAIQLAAGASTVDITYTHSFDQLAGEILSSVSLVLLIIFCRPKKHLWD